MANPYNDYTRLGPVPINIQTGEKDPTSIQLARDMRNKAIAEDVRETMARMIEWTAVLNKFLTKFYENTSTQNSEYYRQFTDAISEFSDLKPRAELSITRSAEALTKSQSALHVANGIDAKATTALNLSKSADALSKSVQSQFNQVVIDGDSSVEAAQARVDASGQTNATLKARLDKEHNRVTTQLAQTDNEIIQARGGKATLGQRLDETTALLENKASMNYITGVRSIVENSDFEEVPYINSRSGIYNFFVQDKSLVIEASSYEASIDANKDFALILTESVLPGDELHLKFKGRCTVGNGTNSIRARLAYAGTGNLLDFGEGEGWQNFDMSLDLSGLDRPSNYLYFDFLGSKTIEFKDFVIYTVQVDEKQSHTSLKQLNQTQKNNALKVRNSIGTINKMIEVAQTYQDEIGNIVYGNQFTAYDKEVSKVLGKYEMDCSSFVSLILHGVEYSKSRYNQNGNENNPLFFNDINSEKFRYANNMARFAFENGFSFYPNDDYSNLRPGDILFFNWKNSSGDGDLDVEAKRSAFMGIEHVAIYLNKNNDRSFKTLQQYPSSNSVYYDATDSYMSQCVMVARFPFGNVLEAAPENLIVHPNDSKSSDSSIDIGIWLMKRPFRRGQFYTAVVDGDIAGPTYFLLLSNNRVIYSDNMRVSEKGNTKYFTFQYLLTDVVPVDRMKISVATATNFNATVNRVTLYEGLVTEETTSKKALNLQRSMPLIEGLKNDLDPTYHPQFEYQFGVSDLNFCINLPFKTSKTGNLTLGLINNFSANKNQRIPALIISEQNTIVPGVIQISASGTIIVLTYNTTIAWKHVISNGKIFTN